MNAANVLRFTALGVSAAAMIVGLLVMGGLLVPVYVPEQFRVVMGTVVFLYGVYRFVVTYYGKKSS